MTTLAASPRRNLTALQKRQRDDTYRVDVKKFGEILRGLVQVYNALNLLTSALGQAGKGAYLAFPNPNPEQPGTMIPFNRKHLRSAQAAFAKSILELKNYLRVSKKKTRDPVLPESFSGTYTPVYAGEALKYFFTAAPQNFGPLHPIEAVRTQQAGQALMDNLPMVREGFLLRNTSTMLFYIYAHAYVDPETGEQGLQAKDNAQFARSDDVMMTAFGGNIPAAFYAFRGQDGKPAKITMAQAIQQGVVQAPGLNTYQVIQVTRPDFNPNRFNTYFYQNIAAANYYSKAALAADPTLVEVAEGLQRPDIRQAMLNEHNLVKTVSAEWHELLEPGRKIQRDARKREKDLMKKQVAGQRGQGGQGAQRGQGGQ